MTGAQFVTQTWLVGFPKAFVFQFASGSNKVIVAVPIIDNGGAISGTSEPQQTISLASVQDSAFYGLKAVDSSSATSITLSTFNILNDITNGKFYQLMDTSSMTTLLIAKVHYQFTRDLGAGSTDGLLFDGSAFNGLPSSTGDVLCWGSQSGYGFVRLILSSSKRTCGKAYHCGPSSSPRSSTGYSTSFLTKSLPKSTSVASRTINGLVGACTLSSGSATKSFSRAPPGPPLSS